MKITVTIDVNKLPFRLTIGTGVLLLIASLGENFLRLTSNRFSFWNLSGIFFSLGFLAFWALLYKRPSAEQKQRFFSDAFWIGCLIAGAFILSGLSSSVAGSSSLVMERSADLWRYATGSLFFGLIVCAFAEERLMNPEQEAPAQLALAKVYRLFQIRETESGKTYSSAGMMHQKAQRA